MRQFRFAPIALTLVAACSEAAAGPDLASLISGNTAARGGAEAIQRVATFESDMRIVEPAFAVDGTYVATRDGRMRIDISVDGNRVFIEALDHGRTWSWSPDQGVREGSDAGAAALRHGIEFPLKLFGLHEVQSRGHRLEHLGRESVDGVDYHVLGLTLADGFEVRYYLNTKTNLIDRERTRRALHVDMDPTPEWIETAYDDYRAAGGVLFPHRQVERRLATGEVLATTTVRAIRVNPPLAADRFLPP